VLVGAVVTGIVVTNNRKAPVDGNQTTVNPPEDSLPTGGKADEDKLPEFAAPTVGTVTKSHDVETLVHWITTDDWRVHHGIDISASAGATVTAAADGVIQSIYDDPMYGKCIRIAHKGDAVTIYANLAAELPEGIAEGVSVKCGQAIATVGESAAMEIAEEPHLHFEMKIADKEVDPMDYISATSAALQQDVSYEG